MIHDGIPREFVRGTLVLTDPGCVHEYRPRDAGGGAFVELTFDLRRADSSPLTLKWADLVAAWFGSATPWQNTPVTIPPPHLERITGYMDDVISALTGSDHYNEPAAALAMGRFILELCRYFDGENYARDENTGDRIEQARILLEQRFASAIGISDLAEVACLSEGAFIRSFSARYGVPPMTYRKRLRITAAQHLLSVSGRPIGEIATNVGYSDIYTFSRTFKAVTGCTASEWRNRTGK